MGNLSAKCAHQIRKGLLWASSRNGLDQIGTTEDGGQLNTRLFLQWKMLPWVLTWAGVMAPIGYKSTIKHKTFSQVQIGIPMRLSGHQTMSHWVLMVKFIKNLRKESQELTCKPRNSKLYWTSGLQEQMHISPILDRIGQQAWMIHRCHGKQFMIMSRCTTIMKEDKTSTLHGETTSMELLWTLQSG